MSIREIDHAIRDLSERDGLIQAPGWCRYAAEKMKRVAEKADKTAPWAKKEILVYPKASAISEIHYALKVSDSQGNIRVYNPNPTAMFPQYIGPLESAPGFIPKMIVAQEVL